MNPLEFTLLGVGSFLIGFFAYAAGHRAGARCFEQQRHAMRAEAWAEGFREGRRCASPLPTTKP